MVQKASHQQAAVHDLQGHRHLKALLQVGFPMCIDTEGFLSVKDTLVIVQFTKGTLQVVSTMLNPKIL